MLTQVNFLTKLVALKPGTAVQEMIKNVMQGKDEGAESSGSDGDPKTKVKRAGGITGRVRLGESIMSSNILKYFTIRTIT